MLRSQIINVVNKEGMVSMVSSIKHKLITLLLSMSLCLLQTTSVGAMTTTTDTDATGTDTTGTEETTGNETPTTEPVEPEEPPATTGTPAPVDEQNTTGGGGGGSAAGIVVAGALVGFIIYSQTHKIEKTLVQDRYTGSSIWNLGKSVKNGLNWQLQVGQIQPWMRSFGSEQGYNEPLSVLNWQANYAVQPNLSLQANLGTGLATQSSQQRLSQPQWFSLGMLGTSWLKAEDHLGVSLGYVVADNRTDIGANAVQVAAPLQSLNTQLAVDGAYAELLYQRPWSKNSLFNARLLRANNVSAASDSDPDTLLMLQWQLAY